MVKVSVIVPIYNVEVYLQQCLESLVRQTMHEIEIICIDDGSTDSSGEILDQYAQKTPQMIAIHNVNHGYGYSVNEGIRRACGKYICIVESDDWVKEDMCERLYAIAEETKVDFVKTDYYQYYHNIDNLEIYNYVKLSTQKEYYNRILKKEPDIGVFLWERYIWAGIYRTEFLRSNELYLNESQGAAYQDIGLWFCSFCMAKSFYLLNEAYYVYRTDNPNSSVRNQTNIHSVMDEYNFVHNKLQMLGLLETPYEKIWSYRCAIDYHWSFIRLNEESRLKAVGILRDFLLHSIQAGLLDDYIPNNMRVEFFSIMLDAKKYAEKYTVIMQRNIDLFSKYKNIICFGAGGKGNSSISYLKDLNMHYRIKGVAVSEKKEETFCGLPVYQIGELVPFKEESIVLIGTGSKFFDEIRAILQEYGFKYYVTINELF